jgi:hypothetical protein
VVRRAPRGEEFVVVAIWNTTNARADATNSIITTNVPTTAQP